MPVARVISPGMFSTVQDLGRPGHCALGVPLSGAADALSLRLGNRLLGNADDNAAIEFTLIGPSLEFSADTVVCIAGAGCPDARVGDGVGARPIHACVPTRVRAGERLTVGALTHGARGCLCVAGGFDVPPVLGSRATLVSAGIGGYHGRALRSGDALPLSSSLAPVASEELSRSAAQWLDAVLSRRTLRITPSLHTPLFARAAIESLTGGVFTLTDRSNRAGLRLSGPALGAPPLSGSLASEGVVAGCVQVPADGQPIILGVDGPTTGGYAVLACVIGADLPLLGAARPREALRFELTTLDEARRAFRDLERALNDMAPGRAGLRTLDLNADIGEAVTLEQMEIEAALMRVVTSVNIACGGHAGDDASMRRAVALAAANGCAIGAHPSYPDREGFGRRRVEIAPEDLCRSIAAQIASLGAIVVGAGQRLSHIKPHGALYHAASEHEWVARAVMDAAHDWDPHITLVGAAGSPALARWRAWGASALAEGFVDRAYEPDGSLRSRSLPGAVIGSASLAARQALGIATDARVTTPEGATLALKAETLCLHADTPGAVEIASRVAAELRAAGIMIRSPR